MRCKTGVLATMVAMAISAYGQSASTQPQTGTPAPQQTSAQSQPVVEKDSKHHKNAKGAGADVGSGAGDIGKGAAKGTGDLAKGTGKGAVDLVTLHPVNAATDIGKGAGKAGGHVAVGTVKGTGKVVKGTGKAIKKICFFQIRWSIGQITACTHLKKQICRYLVASSNRIAIITMGICMY